MSSRLEMIVRPARESRWDRFLEQVRSITLGPWSTKDPALARYFGSGSRASAGIVVNEENSLTYAAVWNAVVLISNDVAKVPLQLHRTLPNGGHEPFKSHPLYELLHDEPNPEMSSFVFRRTMQGHVLVWGDGFAEIERDGANRPVAVWPLMPYSVTPFRIGNTLRYRVRQPSGTEIEFDRRNILHLSGFGIDGTSGYPPIRKAMESLGLGLAAERFGSTFYGNGATFGGVIKFPAGAAGNQQAREEFKRALELRHTGIDRAHRLLALYDGGEYQQIGIPPEASQFLETRRFQVEEVARWFNLPVHKLKELARSTNNNIEHQGIEYTQDTLEPWYKMWEGELRLKLIPRLERKQQFFEHMIEALTRGDSAAQGSLLGQQFAIGSITPNEVRAKFNMNPRPDGDDIYVPSQSMPADIARRYWEAQIEATLAKAKSQEQTPPQTPTETEDTKALRAELEAARKKAQEHEDLRDLALADLAKAEARAAASAGELVAEIVKRDAETASLDLKVVGLEAERDDAIANATASKEAALQATIAMTEAQAELQRERADSSELRESVQSWMQEAKGQSERAEEAEQHALVADEATRVASATLTDTQAELQRERDGANELRESVQIWMQDAKGHSERAEASEQALANLKLTVTALEETRTAQAGRVAALEQTLTEKDKEREDIREERDAATRDLSALTTRYHDLEQVVQRVEAQAAARESELTKELDIVRDAFTAAQAEQQVLRTEMGSLQQTLTALQLEAQSLKTERDLYSADIDTLQDDVKILQAAAEIKTRRDVQVLSAMRGVFVDVLERVTQREADRARKHQATAEKLRAWAKDFYPMHTDVCRSALKPVLDVWAVMVNQEAEPLLDQIVTTHIAQSRQAMEHAAEAEDLSMALERTLRRWETERAGATADALVREGMAGHG